MIPEGENRFSDTIIAQLKESRNFQSRLQTSRM